MSKRNIDPLFNGNVEPMSMLDKVKEISKLKADYHKYYCEMENKTLNLEKHICELKEELALSKDLFDKLDKVANQTSKELLEAKAENDILDEALGLMAEELRVAISLSNCIPKMCRCSECRFVSVCALKSETVINNYIEQAKKSNETQD
jgi:hypothetical protein